MTLWLLVLLGLFLLWLALAPRSGERVLQVRPGILSRLPFVKRAPSISSERVRPIVLDAAHAANEMGGATSVAELGNFTNWLEGLSSKDLNTFAQALNRSLRQNKVNLNWINDTSAGGTTQHVLQEVILLNALGVWRAHTLAPLAQLETYLANPNARGNRVFAQKVFAKIAVSEPTILSPEMMLASEKERSKYVHAAIAQAARDNQDRVVGIVRDVMNESVVKRKMPAPASPPPAEPKALPPATSS